MKQDLVEFKTPYSKANKIKRMVWNAVWLLLARPFPRSTAMSWKRFLLRLFGAKIASTANVYASAKVFAPWNLVMDDYSCIADGVQCYNAAPVTIGRNSTVSQRTFLCTAGHDITDIHNHQTESPIVIGEMVWICAEAYIGQGLTIGDGAVCAARAVVVKDVDPWTVVGGNPAKFIKKRLMDDKCDE
ncbi:MAG: putative colanic acid biosynthesis acetyltransferase [Marinilabiliaceae bacterium]|nr:putative colanic acid biosynthesis acetyltransferase [Marinilabiliaceae bacterium]